MNVFTTTAVYQSLSRLFAELTDGSAEEAAWVLNPGDPGLFRSLEKLSAAAASAPPPSGGASIAAHVEHLRYGLSLLIRWCQGEDPFAGADYAASWRRTHVSEHEWVELRNRLRTEAHQWREAIRQPRGASDLELTGIIASVAHLAYHLGAIRQIDRTIGGPVARD